MSLQPLTASSLIHGQGGIDLPCANIMPCDDCSCDTLWTWIDPCLMTCATLLTIVAIAFAFFQAAFQTAILLIPIALVNGYISCALYVNGEEARLQRSAEMLATAAGGLKQTEASLAGDARNLELSLATAKGNVQGLQLVNASIVQSAETISEKAGEKGNSEAALQAANAQLQQANRQLTARQAKLQEDLQRLTKLVDGMTGQAQFSDAIQALQRQKSALATGAAQLKKEAGSLDQTWDENVRELAEKIQLADALAKKTQEIYAARQQAMDSATKGLQKADKELDVDHAQISQQVTALKQIEASIAQKSGELEQVSKQLEATRAQIAQEGGSLSKQKEELQALMRQATEQQSKAASASQDLLQKQRDLVSQETRLKTSMEQLVQAKQGEVTALQTKIDQKGQELQALLKKIQEATPAKKA